MSKHLRTVETFDEWLGYQMAQRGIKPEPNASPAIRRGYNRYTLEHYKAVLAEAEDFARGNSDDIISIEHIIA